MIPLTLYSWNPRAMCKQRKYHALSTEGIGISWMVGGSVRLKRLTLHFLGGGGGGVLENNPIHRGSMVMNNLEHRTTLQGTWTGKWVFLCVWGVGGGSGGVG